MSKKLTLFPIPPFFSISKQATIGFMIALLLICGSIPFKSHAADSGTTWLKQGVYAEYRFSSSAILFPNGTFLWFPKESKAKATLRWECIYATENASRLNVTLSFDKETQDIRFSALLDVDFKTRRVVTLDGKYFGMTFLWLPPDLEANQTIAITDGVIGNVTGVGLVGSPQGLQEAFSVMGMGRINGQVISPYGSYDLETGVLLESDFWGEPTLLAMGVLDPGLAGRTEFTTTNIDLGPGKPMPRGLSAGSPEALLVAVALAGTFALTFVAVLRRMRSRRRATRTKRSAMRACLFRK